MLKTVFAILFCLCVAGAAKADNVQLFSGSITGTTVGVDNPYSINVAGTDNFSLTVPLSEPFVSNANNALPLPGQTFTVFASVPSGLNPFANVTYQGINYNGVRFSGTLVLSPLLVNIPLDTSSTFVADLPFTVSGSYAFSEFDFTPLFSVDFSGSGLARMNLQYNASLGRFSVTSMQYTFQPQPVPEPTSVLLLSLGLAGLSAARRIKKLF